MSVGQLTRGTDASAGGALASRKAIVLAVCCAAQFMVILDLSIVNVALPSIQVSLKFSSADLSWVVDAYAISFAGFLMLAGRAADALGQRRVFVAGLALFALASLTGGTAGTSLILIIARGAQGFGGALMAASSLAIITSTFAAGPERHRAIGLWGAMNGAGGAAGVLFGGIITEEWSWRWVLLINVPLAIAAAIVAFRVVAARAARETKGFDLLGALVLTASLVTLAYGGVEAGLDGFGSAHFWVPFIVGNIVFAAFPVIEKRATAPLVPPGSFSGPLRLTNIIVVLFSAAIFPMWFIGSLYLQQVLALSPVKTGLTFLPITAMIFICARASGKLVGRAGVKPVLSGGLLMLAAGIALMGRINYGGSAIQYILLPGVLVGLGIGFSIVPSTIAATMGAGAGQAGLASGLVNTSRQVGGGLGLAVLVSIANQRTSHLVGSGQPIAQALTDGFRLGYLVAAGLVAVAALMTIFLLRIPAPQAAAAPAVPAPAPSGEPGPLPATPAEAVGVEAPDAAQAAAAIPAGGDVPPPGPPQRDRPLGRLVPLAAVGIIAVFGIVDFVIPRSGQAPIGAYTTKGTFHFVSAPNLHPPILHVQTPANPATFPGYIVMANFLDVTRPPLVGQSGPMLLDSNLQPVYFRPLPTSVVAGNTEVQSYQGQPVMTWWQGNITATGLINSGEDVVVNDHYQTIATLHAQGGWVLTLHGFVIRGHDAWVTVNRNTDTNLSPYGGVNDGVLVQSGVQEYDLRTGKLLYTWNATGHVPLDDSYTVPPPNGFPWDAYHVNAIDPQSNGTFLVSFRNTWSALLVNQRTGNVIWTFGGKHSDFTVPNGAAFQWQHDPELHGNNDISLFDDHCCEITGAGQYLDPDGPSRALEFHLNTTTHTATVLKKLDNNQGFDAEYMGNAELLPGGSVFVGWGDAPFMSLYSPTGKVEFQAILPSPNISYRIYVQHWTGIPLTLPSGAARTRNGKTTVYASWNGATEVTGWKVLSVDSAGTPQTLAQAKRSGFETDLTVPAGSRNLEVQALSADGRVLGTSHQFQPAG